MNNEILKLADECFTDGLPYDQLEAFYNEAFNAGIEAAADAFEGQYTDSCPQRNISKTICALEKKAC